MQLKKQLKHFLSISQHVAEICTPLKKLGIIGFFYIRQYPNIYSKKGNSLVYRTRYKGNKLASLLSRPKPNQVYLEKT